MANVNVIKLLGELYLDDYSEAFVNSYEDFENFDDDAYDCSFDEVDGYPEALCDFLCDHQDIVEQTITDCGWKGCDCDIFHAIEMAQQTYIEECIKENKEEIMLALAYNYLIENGYDEVDEDVIETICNNDNSGLFEVTGSPELHWICDRALEEFYGNDEDEDDE